MPPAIFHIQNYKEAATNNSITITFINRNGINLVELAFNLGFNWPFRRDLLAHPHPYTIQFSFHRSVGLQLDGVGSWVGGWNVLVGGGLVGGGLVGGIKVLVGGAEVGGA